MTIFNLWKTPERLWVLGPALGWGIGILAHGLSVFGGGRVFGPEWERRQIEKRLGRKLALVLGAGFAFAAAAPDVQAQAQTRRAAARRAWPTSWCACRCGCGRSSSCCSSWACA